MGSNVSFNKSHLHLESITSFLSKNNAVKQFGSPAVFSIKLDGHIVYNPRVHLDNI